MVSMRKRKKADPAVTKPVKKVAEKKAAKKPTKKPTKKSTDTVRKWPVYGDYPVSNPYGKKNPRYARGYHTGTDFAVPEGTPVIAPWDGVIQKVDNSPSDYGLYLELMGTGRKRMWLFAHLSHVEYRAGTHVKKGQKIALSGNSGNSSGPHLHAEERVSPFRYGDDQKPTAWRE